MISISLCMIVKNEAEILARCLDSLAGLMDEIIIVDTGSTDDTKEIARQYTDLVYDFSWCDDFAAARNFSFSKATKEYIYAPDADEVLDETNRRRFQILKSALLPEIEIVTMKYITPAKYNTVQNASSDIRPKLFKRLRTFTWINPVHETVRLDPIVYDSDIEIQHLPQSFHGKRDFTIFKRSIEKNGTLPKNITTMYAKEPDEESTCILARYYRLKDQTDKFFSVALKNVAVNGCSEVCSELGSYYLSKKNYDEASLWFYNAAFETKPVLDVETGGVIPLNGLAETYAQMANAKRKTLEALPPSSHGKFAGDESMIKQLEDEAYKYRKMAEEWMLPDE